MCAPRSTRRHATHRALAGVVAAMFTLGLASGLDRRQVSESLGDAAAVAAILLIVGAGGGFKQTLVDAGVGDGRRAAADSRCRR